MCEEAGIVCTTPEYQKMGIADYLFNFGYEVEMATLNPPVHWFARCSSNGKKFFKKTNFHKADAAETKTFEMLENHVKLLPGLTLMTLCGRFYC